MALPVVFVERNKRKQVNGRFKEKHCVICADPVKAVSWVTTGHIALEAAFGARAALVGVDGDAGRGFANEHGVVTVGRLVDQSGADKRVQYIPVNAASNGQIRIHATVVPVWRRKNERLLDGGQDDADRVAVIQ